MIDKIIAKELGNITLKGFSKQVKQKILPELKACFKRETCIDYEKITWDEIAYHKDDDKKNTFWMGGFSSNGNAYAVHFSYEFEDTEDTVNFNYNWTIYHIPY